MTGFEPAASASRTQRSTKLSHISISMQFSVSLIILSQFHSNVKTFFELFFLQNQNKNKSGNSLPYQPIVRTAAIVMNMSYDFIKKICSDQKCKKRSTIITVNRFLPEVFVHAEINPQHCGTAFQIHIRITVVDRNSVGFQIIRQILRGIHNQ